MKLKKHRHSSLDKEKASERESLFIVSEFAKKFFKETLLNSQEGKSIGLSYFKERGFSDETIKKFDLGYLPEKSDYFSSNAIKNGYDPDFFRKIRSFYF